MTDATAPLIAELEAATEGSVVLDEAIAVALGWVRQCGSWRVPGKKYSVQRAYKFTTSIDRALTLVPEGDDWTVMSGAIQAAGVGLVSIGNPIIMANTPALAVCIAALKARAAA